MLSLEAYLIHIHFVLVYIQPMGLGYWGTFAATVAITLPVAWVGTISAALFVLHPLTRKIFIPISRHGDVYTGLLLYIVASIALAWFYHNFKLRNEDTKH